MIKLNLTSPTCKLNAKERELRRMFYKFRDLFCDINHKTRYPGILNENEREKVDDLIDNMFKTWDDFRALEIRNTE